MHLQQLHSTSLYTIILFHHLHDSTLHFNISILGDFPPKKPSTKHPQNLRHLYRPAFSRWTNLKTSSLQKVEIQGHEPWPSRSRLRCHYGSTVPKWPRCHPTDQAGRLAPPNFRHCCFFFGGGLRLEDFNSDSIGKKWLEKMLDVSFGDWWHGVLFTIFLLFTTKNKISKSVKRWLAMWLLIWNNSVQIPAFLWFSGAN